jgi:hypothetical protein
MARKGRWRRYAMQIAMMSVLMHAVLAALMLSQPAAAISAAGIALQASGICSVLPSGAVAYDESGFAGKQAPAKPCPICDGIATSGFLLELSPTAFIGRLTNPTVLRPAGELAPASFSCHAQHNRGPPALL